MIQHEIIESTTGRVIIVRANDLMRYSLYSGNKPLQFKRTGGRAIAIAAGPVKVFKKPGIVAFSKEHILQNNRTLYHFNSIADDDMIINGLSEYEKEI